MQDETRPSLVSTNESDTEDDIGPDERLATVVHAAYDPQLDRKVALELLEPRGSDPAAARARLQREAQALAKLDHPNVVAVHDVGVHEGQLFVGMDFIAGQTLGAWMKQAQDADGPRPPVWSTATSSPTTSCSPTP